MKRWAEKFPNADFNLVFDFSARMPIGKAQNIMLCDWTIDYVVRIQNCREPSAGEYKCIQRQHKALKTADKVITILPYMQEFMKKDIHNIYYIGNGINSRHYVDSEIKDRFHSNKILFIGRETYRKGAIKLIEAINEYNKIHGMILELHIIGMTSEYLQVENIPFVKCYGFLNKDNSTEEQQYYQLLGSAKIFCNPNDHWSGAQSLMEACYWKLPAIVAPNEEIIKIYGKHPPFGEYCVSESHQIRLALEKILSLDEEMYAQLMKNAYDCVQDSTWDAFASRLISLLNNK